MTDFRSEAKRWLAAEPDEDMREELESLIAGADDALALRFDGRLQFGTAGLRAAVGAGPQRMNRLVVQQAAAGLAEYLLKSEPDAATRGVIIGYDARRKSDAFARDTARVCAARGIRAMIFRHVVPTPMLAWNIVGVGAAAGVVVTASHNPPADNGYKVFTAQGAQIVSPVDAGIAACIDLIDPCAVQLAPLDDPLIEWLDESYVEAYLAAVPAVRLRPDVPGVPVAYSAMHGVGGKFLLAAFERAGFAPPSVVPQQQEPDPKFPTVAFPNPEEPGAMDLLLAKAAEFEAAIALCNDPDADRLGAAIPTPEGGWRRLGGDEIGWLLADHILRHTTGDDRLVITTLVSSSLLAKMATAYGIRFAETYTGFKWIGHTVLSHPESHFVFGYEQALGFLVCGQPLDKDGITAAVLLAEVAALARTEGVTLQGRLDAINAQFGRHVMADMSVKMPPADGSAAVAKMRADPPKSVDDRQVTDVQWFDEAGLLRLQLGPELRLQLRPSGTEPKVKLYGEGIDIDPAPYLASLATHLA
jgi:phosphomannomutase